MPCAHRSEDLVWSGLAAVGWHRAILRDTEPERGQGSDTGT